MLLASKTQHILEICGLSSSRGTSTIIYEDNVAYITRMKRGYIKKDRTKYILSKFFFTHDLDKYVNTNVQ